MLDSIRRLRHLGRLTAISARRAGADLAAAKCVESRIFNRAWRGAKRMTLRIIIVEIRGIRADCDHDWEDDYEHEADEVPVSMNPFTDRIHYEVRGAQHVGSRTCKDCGIVEQVDEPCECDPRDSGACHCKGEKCNC